MAALFRADLEGNRDPQGGVAEAEEHSAAGRRIGPEAVTEQTAGYKTADAFGPKFSSAIWLQKSADNRSCDSSGHDDRKRTARLATGCAVIEARDRRATV